MNVIVSLTTIPERLNSPENFNEGIKSNLLSLVNQDYNNYEIHFNVPTKRKYDGKDYVIPDWILGMTETYSNFHIFNDVEDIGPVTKLVPTVARIENPEDIIIVVDDDLVYRREMVTEQVKNQTKFPGSPVGYDGMRSKDHFFKDVRDYYFTSNYRSSRVDILQHYKTVSYKRSYFEEDFNEFITNNLTWNDDLLLAAYFAYKKRDRIATFHESDIEFKTLEEWQQGGGVTTFPVIRHTNHGGLEGCNAYRQDTQRPNFLGTTTDTDLYKRYVDHGYNK